MKCDVVRLNNNFVSILFQVQTKLVFDATFLSSSSQDYSAMHMSPPFTFIVFFCPGGAPTLSAKLLDYLRNIWDLLSL